MELIHLNIWIAKLRKARGYFPYLLENESLGLSPAMYVDQCNDVLGCIRQTFGQERIQLVERQSRQIYPCTYKFNTDVKDD